MSRSIRLGTWCAPNRTRWMASTCSRMSLWGNGDSRSLWVRARPLWPDLLSFHQLRKCRGTDWKRLYQAPSCVWSPELSLGNSRPLSDCYSDPLKSGVWRRESWLSRATPPSTSSDDVFEPWVKCQTQAKMARTSSPRSDYFSSLSLSHPRQRSQALWGVVHTWTLR